MYKLERFCAKTNIIFLYLEQQSFPFQQNSVAMQNGLSNGIESNGHIPMSTTFPEPERELINLRLPKELLLR